MFTDKHYVPAIRWRQGEYTGLKELSPVHRQRLTPLVDIPPIPWDFNNDQPAKAIDQHLKNVPDQMVDAWGVDRPIFVDLGLIEPTMLMTDGQHPAVAIFAALAQNGVQAIPVTSTDRDASYQTAVQTILNHDQRGLCIRASADDVEETSGTIAQLILDFQVDISEVDLVIDFRSIEGNQVNLLRRLVVTAINGFPTIGGYRTVTLLSGAFPLNLSAIPPGLTKIQRADWVLWRSVCAGMPARIPTFGDYTATHPDQEDVDPRIMQPSASIRYAVDGEWLIAKGKSVRNPNYGGFTQYQILSKSIQAHAEFTGHAFSWASNFIEACAGGGPTGNLTTWRKVASNRHMAWTAHQIANLP